MAIRSVVLQSWERKSTVLFILHVINFIYVPCNAIFHFRSPFTHQMKLSLAADLGGLLFSDCECLKCKPYFLEVNGEVFHLSLQPLFDFLQTGCAGLGSFGSLLSLLQPNGQLAPAGKWSARTYDHDFLYELLFFKGSRYFGSISQTSIPCSF